MLLLEHQGKALLRRHGIATPKGSVVTDEAALAEAVGDGTPKVLKAQVAAGGRGKAGGIRFAAGRDEALAAFAALRAMTVGGHRVGEVLVEERVDFVRERYAAIQVESGRLWLLFAGRGGVDIEKITEHDAANLRAVEVDVLEGPDKAELGETFAELGFPRLLWGAYEEIAQKLFTLARASDAITVEINPMVETPDGRLVALDARVFLDEAALARQPDLAALLREESASGGPASSGPRFKANPEGGSIGLIGFGSGLNLTLMDWIASLGGKVGTLVDVDAMVTGGRAAEGFTAALQHMDQNPFIKAALVPIISCGNKMDDVVQALITALQARPRDAKPVILHLRGNRMSRAQPLLDQAGLNNTASLAEAIDDLVEAAP